MSSMDGRHLYMQFYLIPDKLSSISLSLRSFARTYSACANNMWSSVAGPSVHVCRIRFSFWFQIGYVFFWIFFIHGQDAESIHVPMLLLCFRIIIIINGHFHEFAISFNYLFSFFRASNWPIVAKALGEIEQSMYQLVADRFIGKVSRLALLMCSARSSWF